MLFIKIWNQWLSYKLFVHETASQEIFQHLGNLFGHLSQSAADMAGSVAHLSRFLVFLYPVKLGGQLTQSLKKLLSGLIVETFFDQMQQGGQIFVGRSFQFSCQVLKSGWRGCHLNRQGICTFPLLKILKFWIKCTKSSNFYKFSTEMLT